MEYIYTEDVYTYLTYLRNTRLNLTYRLHSFIPCLSYDVPTIKISYDERAISMLDTLGINEWNINMLHDNVIEEVEQRINHLNDLPNIKAGLKDHWQGIRTTISTGCEKFAEKVIKNI